MIKSKYNLILALILLTIAPSLANDGSILKKEFTRQIKETFPISNDGLLGIQNKYGNISITTSDRNNVEISVLIKVKSNSESKGKKYFDGIDISFENSPTKVMAKTVLPDEENDSWFSLWPNNKNVDIEIHYAISAPKDINIDLIDKYGNISISEITGTANIENKYGDVNIETIGNDLQMDLGYGNASISNMNDATLLIKYSKVKVGKGKRVAVESKYSTLSFENIATLKSLTKYDNYKISNASHISNEGKYDTWNIGQIGEINIDSKYTDIVVNELGTKASFNTSYGGVKIDKVINLVNIDIHAKYTDYTIGIDCGFDLVFDGDYADIDLPTDAIKNHYEKDGSDLYVKASRDGGSGKIRADIEYGKLRLR
jgi:hypothetical protein